MTRRRRIGSLALRRRPDHSRPEEGRFDGIQLVTEATPAIPRVRAWIANAAVTLGALALSLVLVEVGLRFFAPQPISGAVLEYAPRGYFVSRSSGSALFAFGGNAGAYHFLSPHLRGSRLPPDDAVRILAVGDSFTFGIGLREEETTVAKLQAKIDATFGHERVALLNAGMQGSGTAEHVAFLEDFGDTIAPRAVLVFVSFDDFGRAERSPLYRLRNYETLELDEGSAPIGRLKQVVSRSRAYRFAIEHFHLVQLVRRAVLRLAYFSSQKPAAQPARQLAAAPASAPVSAHDGPPDQRRLVRALFHRMKAWCDARGVKLAVINNGWRTYAWLPGLLESEHIAHFDAAPQLQPVIAQAPAAYVIPDDGHPNAKGANLIAEAAWPFIRTFIAENVVDGASRAQHSNR